MIKISLSYDTGSDTDMHKTAPPSRVTRFEERNLQNICGLERGVQFRQQFRMDYSKHFIQKSPTY